MEPSSWAVILLCLVVVALILELLTPTMGGFTLLALLSAAGSVWLAFRGTDTFGYMMLAANLAAFPLALWLGVRFLKKSPLMLHSENTSGNQSSPDAPPLTALLGQEGQALTPLRPAGSAMFGTRRVDVVAQGRFVESGTAVKVIQIEGSRVVVEPVDA